MSTFNGFVSEFPHIRIDQFRPLLNRPPPLACFLSHVHSDHLGGLESLKAPFVYCSPSTRELLLRLEKYPHRMNFSKGVLECRKQTYKHLRTLLKTIPLETPTRIELSPGNDIQVTLFDANHCAGAVMFLIEGRGKGILYTGDIRAESWWVNSIARHPKLLPYTFTGPGGRTLDRMYFDTTFATSLAPYRDFPSKADGLRELFAKISTYPPSIRFYFHAWTFGYEDVWLALSSTLNSPIHLDRYRYGMYTSLARNSGGSGLESREAPFLCGFKCGNVLQPGCVTRDEDVRLHSCEKGTACSMFKRGGGTADDVVEILPIISRFEGREMGELGAGGGKGDLDQSHELDVAGDPAAVAQMLALCQSKITDPAVLGEITRLLTASLAGQGKLEFDLPTHDDEGANVKEEADPEDAPLPLKDVVDILSHLVVSASHATSTVAKSRTTITFPYSRHSSYNELLHLVSTFHPADVYPCVAPPAQHWQEETMSMQVLFGECCADPSGRRAWDEEMRKAVEEIGAMREQGRRRESQQREEETQSEDEGGDDGEREIFETAPQEGAVRMSVVHGDDSSVVDVRLGSVSARGAERMVIVGEDPTSALDEPLRKVPKAATPPITTRAPNSTPTDHYLKPPTSILEMTASTSTPPPTQNSRKRPLQHSQPHLTPSHHLQARQRAYDAAASGGWARIKLQSTRALRRDGVGSDEEL